MSSDYSCGAVASSANTTVLDNLIGKLFKLKLKVLFKFLIINLIENNIDELNGPLTILATNNAEYAMLPESIEDLLIIPDIQVVESIESIEDLLIIPNIQVVEHTALTNNQDNIEAENNKENIEIRRSTRNRKKREIFTETKTNKKKKISENNYVVSEISGHRINTESGKVEYLVDWKDYPGQQ